MMITQLGRRQPQRLSVIARTSSMRYKRGDVPIDQIGRELGVDYIIEGSARREGSRVRISATLIHVRDETRRWSDSFERELASVLTLQSDVAGGVARALALTLLPAEQNRLASVLRVDPEAYEAYLRGRFHWQTLRTGGFGGSHELLPACRAEGSQLRSAVHRYGRSLGPALQQRSHAVSRGAAAVESRDPQSQRPRAESAGSSGPRRGHCLLR